MGSAVRRKVAGAPARSTGVPAGEDEGFVGDVGKCVRVPCRCWIFVWEEFTINYFNLIFIICESKEPFMLFTM